MSGTSSVGNAAVYEAGDQRNAAESEQQTDRYEEGQKNSHKDNDSSENPSVATKLLHELGRAQAPGLF